MSTTDVTGSRPSQPVAEKAITIAFSANSDSVPFHATQPPELATPNGITPNGITPNATTPSATVPDAGLSAGPADPIPELSIADDNVRLSYKFQRLREKIRDAISTGELVGRLPGERKLARRFRVNAKTLSKALTDLAAEGVLERSIGRGTFVKGSGGASAQIIEKWLVIIDPEQQHCPVVKGVLAANPDAQCVIGMPPKRPSFLNSFRSVIVFSAAVDEAYIRDLIVRNIPVVVAGRRPSTYSTHLVMIDRAHGATLLARDVFLAGHRQIAVVECQGSTELVSAVRLVAARYAPDANVDAIFTSNALAAAQNGQTAFICDSADTAKAVRESLAAAPFSIPQQISIVAIGLGDHPVPCSGYYVSSAQLTQAITDTLRDAGNKRPVTILLSGQSIDAGTIAPIASIIHPQVASSQAASSPVASSQIASVM